MQFFSYGTPVGPNSQKMPTFLSATNRAVAADNTAMTTAIKSIDLGPLGSTPRRRHV
jgi:hypothetical protein